MNTFNLRRAAAVLGCATALACTAVAPAAAGAAPAAKSCGSKSIVVHTKGSKTTTFSASLIRAEGGATCQEAVAVIRGVVTKNLPSGWTVSRGNFKVPHGLVAQIAVNGRKKVKFALVGP